MNIKICIALNELERLNDKLQWELAESYPGDFLPDMDYYYPHAYEIARQFRIRDTRVNLYNKGLISLAEFDILMKDCGILIYQGNYIEASK